MTDTRTASASPFESQIGFCRALRVGDRIISGLRSNGPDLRCVKIMTRRQPTEQDGISIPEWHRA